MTSARTITVILSRHRGSVDVNGVTVQSRDGAAIADVETQAANAISDSEVGMM